ncbi:MAG: hypothetical protein ACYC5Y_12910 [Symbiobacteriia bacterium]
MTSPATQPVRLADSVLRTAGFWSAVLTTFWSLAFTVAFAAEAATSPPSTNWRGIEAYAATFSAARLALVIVPSLLLAPSFVALMACVHEGAPAAKEAWTRLGLAFSIIYAVVASLNYTIQLIVVRGNVLGPDKPALALVAMDNPHSLFWGLAILGYNFYMTLAGVLMIPALGKGLLDRWISWLFIVNAVATIIGGVFYFVTLNVFHPLGLVATGVWCLAFPAATTLLAVRFRRPASA